MKIHGLRRRALSGQVGDYVTCMYRQGFVPVTMWYRKSGPDDNFVCRLKSALIINATLFRYVLISADSNRQTTS